MHTPQVDSEAAGGPPLRPEALKGSGRRAPGRGPVRFAARPHRGRRGWTLVEVLAVVLVAGLATAIVSPSARNIYERARVRAAARDAAGLLRRCRVQAALENVAVALVFSFDEQGWWYRPFRDGNDNGVRLGETESGVDPALGAEEPFAPRHHDVALEVLGQTNIPNVPPASGVLGKGSPVRFGVSGIVSFSPQGTSSSGTLYVSHGRDHMAAVKLFGPTGRIQLWEYDPAARRWRQFD